EQDPLFDQVQCPALASQLRIVVERDVQCAHRLILPGGRLVGCRRRPAECRSRSLDCSTPFLGRTRSTHTLRLRWARSRVRQLGRGKVCPQGTGNRGKDRGKRSVPGRGGGRHNEYPPRRGCPHPWWRGDASTDFGG